MATGNPEIIDICSSNDSESDDSSDGSYDTDGEQLPEVITGSPIPPPRPVILDDAIALASVDRLRSVLTEICSSQEIYALVGAHLLRILAGSSAETPKFRCRFEVCKYCRCEYDVGTNEEKDCRYHPGTKELDLEGCLLDKYDEEEARELIDDDDEGINQVGWNWSCCDGDGYSKGCARSTHKPKIIADFVSRRTIHVQRANPIVGVAAPKPKVKTAAPANLLTPVSGNATKTEPMNAKRKRTAPEVCRHCHVEYECDVSIGDQNECRSHPGEKEVNYDHYMWADCDEPHPEAEFMLRHEPETYNAGAIWSCCGAVGSDKGCVRNPRHTSQRVRLE